MKRAALPDHPLAIEGLRDAPPRHVEEVEKQDRVEERGPPPKSPIVEDHRPREEEQSHAEKAEADTGVPREDLNRDEARGRITKLTRSVRATAKSSERLRAMS